MKRPIKIHKHVSGKLYIKGNKGNIFINSDVALHRLQAKAVKLYSRNRKRIIRKPETKKLYTVENISQTKLPSVGKDLLYMTAEEKAVSKANGVAESKTLKAPQFETVTNDNRILTERMNIFLADIEALKKNENKLLQDYEILRKENEIKTRLIDEYRDEIDTITKPRRKVNGKAEGFALKPPDPTSMRRFEEKAIAELETKAVADMIEPTIEPKKPRLKKPKGMTENVNWNRISYEEKQQYVDKYTPAPIPTPIPEIPEISIIPEDITDNKPFFGQGFVSMKPTDFRNSGLYENDIEEILEKRDLIRCPVVARDEIPNSKYFIMNLSNRNEEGTHWVAIYTDEYNICYFDCLGNPPTNALRKELISINPETQYLRKFKYNTKQIEPNNEDNCGYHCILFLENMLNGCSFKEATQFTNDDVVKLEEDIDWV